MISESSSLSILFPVYADLALMVEQLTCNQQVVGSNPTVSSLGKLTANIYLINS